MRIALILLSLGLIQVSVNGWPFNNDEVTVTTSSLEMEEDMSDLKNEKLQAEPDEEDDDMDNGDNSDVNNQDDDQEPNLEPTQPSAPIAPQPNNVDQNRGAPGSPPGSGTPETLPLPDYSAVNMRGHLPQCHGGQYQCQKTDPTAPTRCIPQEWRCNGLRDCENNDDESGCSTDQLTRGRTQAKCTQEQYQCHGTGINSVPPHCIERRFVCDGTYHCSYGDDEANCADRRQPSVYPNRNSQRNENTSPQNTDLNNRVDPRDNPRDNPRDPYRPQTNDRSDRKSEEYVQRLEWRDRCFRSCLKY